MVNPHEPLSPEETDELARLLEQSGGRTLAFARGVFAAAATAPTLLQPPEWLRLLLVEELPDRVTLQRLLALVMREYNACGQCLALGVPAVPASDDAAAVSEFCRGYIRVSQGDARWTQDTEAFSLTVPLAWLAGYVEVEALGTFAPEALEAEEAYRSARMASLADDVAALYRYWAEERNKPPPAASATPRIGRNEPCPCGSGKKYKRCCGAA